MIDLDLERIKVLSGQINKEFYAKYKNELERLSWLIKIESLEVDFSEQFKPRVL